MRQALVVALLISLSACNKASSPKASNSDAGNSASRIAAHVRFLSDDLLEGRGVGTRGEKLATAYIATQFNLLGLEPAGDNGTYFQNVPLVAVETLPTSIFAWDHHTLAMKTDYVGVNN